MIELNEVFIVVDRFEELKLSIEEMMVGFITALYKAIDALMVAIISNTLSSEELI